jgi:8-oxo-dGTP diphosphatase
MLNALLFAALTMTGAPLKVVVAGCLVDDRMRVLVAQRPAGKSFAGLWEFPGGKLEPAETTQAGLARELGEELGIRVDPSKLRPLSFSTVDELLMLLFACREWDGVPSGLEGQAVRWVTCSELRDGTLEMPPADIPLIEPIANFVRDEFSPRWDRFGDC